MKTIYFIRHGESQANADGVLAGLTNDSPLTRRGEQQALESAALLSGKKIELIVSSTLARAAETARIIAQAVGYDGQILTSPLLLERDLGSAAGMPREEGLATIDDGTAVGVESFHELGERAKRAMLWLQDLPAEHILVVSHAAFGRMFGTVVSGGRPEDFLAFQRLTNGGIQEFTLD